MSNINIQLLLAIKAAIKLSIIDKGVTVGDDFTTYANAISQIEGGGESEDKSGALGRYLLYCLDNPETITSSNFFLTYQSLTTSLLLGKQYDLTSDSTNYSNSGFNSMFSQNSDINYVDIKLIGTHRGNYGTMFSNCRYLIGANVDFNNRVKYITNASSISAYNVFAYCYELLFCNALNFNGDSLEGFFMLCLKLKSAYLNNVKGSELSNIKIIGTFYNCPELVKIDGINFDTVTSIPNGSSSSNYAFYRPNSSSSNPKLRFMRIRNLGKNGTSGTNSGFNFKSALYLYWGIEDANEPLSKDARQSLIDTLITYSYDRVNAGYTKTCTVSLYSTTMALLTDVEIALITAKGFTLA